MLAAFEQCKSLSHIHRIGEKFLEWTDEDPPLDLILESVTLYWMTDTFPRCIYPYRGVSRDPSDLMLLD
jgi:hypothetical protein